jgi:predicted Zn-dependent protease
VFDERQENADIEAELREDIEAKQGMSAEVAKKYDTLIAEFRKLQKIYESQVISYETKLTAHNREVAGWNDAGGAPAEVVQTLNEEADVIKVEQKELEALAAKLNAIVRELNALGARANTLIKDYNTVVNEYNDRAAEAEEFTQGDYTRDAINVYQFNSEDELILVLAHEFGHALTLDHVANETSIMFRRMGAQEVEGGPTAEDIAEFERVCKKGGVFSALIRVLHEVW